MAAAAAGHARRDEHQRQQQHQHQEEPDSPCSTGSAREASSGHASSWAIRAASGGAVAGSASEAMAEAGRKAASIAEKLDRLLTPGTRAAVHGGAAGVPSRFAAEAGSADWAHCGGKRGNELWTLAAADPGDADDIPLRQRYGSSSSHGQ